MPRRRQSIAPPTEIDALIVEHNRLVKEVKSLRQPGNTTIQAIDTLYYLDPVQGEIIIDSELDQVNGQPRYYHDNDWRDFGGTFSIESFRARQKNHSPKTQVPSGTNTNITFDEWGWIQTSPDATFVDILTVGKLSSINIVKAGIYGFEVEVLWDTEFDATHGILLNDYSLDWAMESLNERGNFGALAGGSDVFSTIRRYKANDLPVSILIQVIQDSGSVKELNASDTFFEVHRIGS